MTAEKRDCYYDGAYRLVFHDDHQHAPGVNITVRLGEHVHLRLGAPLHMEPKTDGTIRRGEVLFTSRSPLSFVPGEWLDSAPSRAESIAALRKTLEEEYGATVTPDSLVTIIGYRVAAL